MLRTMKTVCLMIAASLLLAAAMSVSVYAQQEDPFAPQPAPTQPAPAQPAPMPAPAAQDDPFAPMPRPTPPTPAPMPKPPVAQPPVDDPFAPMPTPKPPVVPTPPVGPPAVQPVPTPPVVPRQPIPVPVNPAPVNPAADGDNYGFPAGTTVIIVASPGSRYPWGNTKGNWVPFTYNKQWHLYRSWCQ
jgi:outer membrane biosynthesis protein TonB